MKKIVLWLMSTTTVLVLLFGYHTSTSSKAAAVGGGFSLAAPSPSGAGAGTGSGSAPAPGGSSAAAAPSSGAAAPSSGSGSTTSGTVTGAVASTRWGPVQVQLTLANGRITDVAIPQYPDGNGRDAEINAQALPILVQETLKAQSAQIDMVSGATVTSDGYLQSLQSALDKAGLH
ncbi:MAG: hypothetical protein JWO98_3484 [Frankiales bacterium]|nr:hypothetical protein [Frankiales bacterium]